MKRAATILLLFGAIVSAQTERINGVPANVRLPGLVNTPLVGVDSNGKLVVGTGGASAAGPGSSIQVKDPITGNLAGYSNIGTDGTTTDLTGATLSIPSAELLKDPNLTGSPASAWFTTASNSTPVGFRRLASDGTTNPAGSITYTDVSGQGSDQLVALDSASSGVCPECTVYPMANGNSYTLHYTVSAVSVTPPVCIVPAATAGTDVALTLTVGAHTASFTYTSGGGAIVDITCTSAGTGSGQSVTFTHIGLIGDVTVQPTVKAPITGSIQCIHALADGTLAGTGHECPTSGGGTASGSENAVQTNVSSAFSGDSGLFASSTNGLVFSNSSSAGTDPNLHRGIAFSYQPADNAGLNGGFPDQIGMNLTTTVNTGFNDSWQTSKLTIIGINNTVNTPASGQRFGMASTVNCLGMGDCFGFSQTLYQYGGLNDDGGEGTGHMRNSLSQGTQLVQANIAAVPTQSQCTGTITQAVSRSTGGAAQAVNFTKTSGAGTCLTGEWIDINRGSVYVDTNHEVTKLTADFGGGKITAIFETNHLINAPVVPAVVLNVDATFQMGEGRYLVNLSSARHTGTISAVSGHQFTISDTIAANVVGGDSILPGIFAATQDNYTGSPFNSTDDRSTLHSFYAIDGLIDSSNFNIAHKDAAGIASYTGKATTGGGYSILRGARIWKIIDGSTVVLEANTFTWTVGDVVENAISADGVVDNTNLFAWYTPGATLYDAYKIRNAGPRSWQTGLSIDSLGIFGSNADATAYDTGISLGGTRPFGVGIGITQATQSAALIILPQADQSSTVNSDIKWNANEGWNIEIGPHANVFTPGAMRVGGNLGGSGGDLSWGALDSLGNHVGSTATALPQLRFSGNLVAYGANGGNAAWLGVANSEISDINSLEQWRWEAQFSGSRPFCTHYLAGNPSSGGQENYPFCVNPNGPYIPSLGTATSSVNYGSGNFEFLGSMRHAGTAVTVGAYLTLVPEAGGADTTYDLQVNMYDPENIDVWPNNLNHPLNLSAMGLLTFGYKNDGTATSHRATLDPSGLTANRTFTLPDIAGTVALVGAAGAVPTSCTGQPTGALWNNAGTPAFCP